MKKILPLLMPLLLLFACSVVPITNNSRNYEIIYMNLTGYSTEGGFLKAYALKDNVIYLSVDMYGETFKTRLEYFFNDNHVIINHFNYKYDVPININSDPLINEIEQFHYLIRDDVVYDFSEESDDLGILSESIQNEIKGTLNEYLDLISETA